MTSTGTYRLRTSGHLPVAGPLGLLAPQAAQAARQPDTKVRVVDAAGNTARITLTPSGLSANWEQPNELFPQQTQAPNWIQRLQTLLNQLASPPAAGPLDAAPQTGDRPRTRALSPASPAGPNTTPDTEQTP